MTDKKKTTDEWFVDGMDCGSCKKTIESGLQKVEGIDSATVQFMTKKLTVEYNSDKISKSTIQEKVKKLGFSLNSIARSDDGQNESHRGHSHDHSHSHAQGRLILTTAILYVLAVLSEVFFRSGQIAFVIATVFAIIPVAKKSFVSAKSGNFFSIESLMIVATIGALFIGAAEEAAMVVLLFSIGEYLESFATNRARKSIKEFLDISPKIVLQVREQRVYEVKADDLKIGDIFEVRPGGRVATDGVIIEGSANFDEAHLTGEVTPIFKDSQNEVRAGSLLLDSTVRIEVLRKVSDSSLSRVLRLVEEAESHKAPTERFVDRFSRIYTPAILIVALLAATIPPLFFGQVWQDWIYRGLTLLLIGCPCALVISVPAAVTSAVSRGARTGLLVKGGAALETVSRVKTVALDKTGTLTLGHIFVNKIESFFDSDEIVAGLFAAVENGSLHPIAKSFQKYAEQLNIKIPAAQNHKAIPGKGVTAKIGDKIYMVASPTHVKEVFQSQHKVFEMALKAEQYGATVVILMEVEDKNIIGMAVLGDNLKHDSATAVEKLKNLGLEPKIVTGDNERAAKYVGDILKISTYAHLLPDDKLNKIEQWKKSGGVLMVGDGINDAPALAIADVGIAIGSGTEVAIEAADVVVSNTSLLSIVNLVVLSKKTMQVIRQNVTISLGLKLIFLVTSVLGVTGLWMAVLADTGGTVLVTLNSLRLLNLKIKT